MNFRVDQTIIDPETDIEFTEEQHDIWNTVYARQAPQTHKYACNDYLEGAFNLKLPTDRILPLNGLMKKQPH